MTVLAPKSKENRHQELKKQKKTPSVPPTAKGYFVGGSVGRVLETSDGTPKTWKKNAHSSPYSKGYSFGGSADGVLKTTANLRPLDKKLAMVTP